MSATATLAPASAQSGSVMEVLADRALNRPDQAAVLSPGRAAMTNQGLLRQAQHVRDTLRALGIRKQDAVALCFPSGPEMTVAYLAVMSCAIAAPLNPASTANELEYYLAGLHAKAVIVQPGLSPARDVAERLGTRILQLTPEPGGPAGAFTLAAPASSPTPFRDDTTPDDIALMLYTSGTTSRAKLVPLSHRNVIASARNVAAPLGLTEQDRCLNVMPLFHSHGLLGATWAAIASGGALISPPAFSAVDFFDWLTECEPTWYSAVPTMHQAILARAAHLGMETFPSTLRLARSASSSMPPPVMAGVERLLGVPLLESYGMSEAGLQIACNPPPPRPRKPGSVGIPFGTEIAIMDDAGRILEDGRTGEIVVRGESVFSGYADNPAATAEAFSDNWLRTGDQGRFDADGYLFITGRLKEIINRGGELVAPREIEEVLLTHPAVAEAIAFSIPDKRLGEEIGAGVVFRPGKAASEREMRDLVSAQLSAMKMPRKILVLQELPKNAVGKLDRIRAAARLGLTEAQASPATPDPSIEPRTELERLLTARWRRALRIDRVSIHQNFFDLGGDSLALVTMISDFERAFDVQLNLGDLLEGPTIANIAALLEKRAKKGARRRLFSIKPEGSRSPLFLIGGGPLQRELADLLPDQPVLSSLLYDYSHMPHPCRVEDIAAEHVRTIRAEQPNGPYYLGGWCKQGVVAYEAARQLQQDKQNVALVVLFDSICNCDAQAKAADPTPKLSRIAEKVRFNLNLLRELRPAELPGFLSERLTWKVTRVKRKVIRARNQIRHGLGQPVTVTLDDFLAIEEGANRRYRTPPYNGKVLLLRAQIRPGRSETDLADGWDKVVTGHLEVHEVPGDHRSMFQTPNVAIVAPLLASALQFVSGASHA